MSKIFETAIEVVQWIKIVLSPLFISAFIGVLIYISNPNSVGIFLFALIIFIGLIIGILWARKVWREQGTNHFMSRIMATPDLDEKEINSNSEKNNGVENP